MRYFRKRPSSSSTRPNSPPPTSTIENIKHELAAFHPKTKDQRALAASSSGIALSIASPSSHLADPALDEPESSKESVWMAAYGAARTAIEIAKDSSDLLPPLKAVMVALSVFIKNYDQTTANADQIREIDERIGTLGGILTLPLGDQDSEEKARRAALRRRLARIIAELEPLSKQHGIARFFKNADHAKILSGFVQDLAYAVTDYQTSLQQSIHNDTKRIDETTKKIGENTQNIIEAADLELLGKLEPVRNAGYQAAHHDTCLRGTRESVLDGIMQWAKDPQDRRVFWLNGLAGTGKSTITQTFSGMVAEAGILGASFFCSRDYLDRRELKNIFPTIAYQLACQYPAFLSHIVRVIKRDPSVAQHSLISQLNDLIVEPLSSTKISCVIVIDALDECVDDQPASAILSVLGRLVKQLPFVKFFITGRPEPRIRTGFRLPLLEPLTQIFLLHGVGLASVDEDIRLYLQEKLIAVAKRRSDLDVSDPWPCDKDLAALTKKSSGLFIFASTLTRFIESEYHDPIERLQLIITSSDRTVHEGRAGIDPLYTQVLTLAFSDAKEATVFADFRMVLGAVVLAFNPLSREQIAEIFDIKSSLITATLRHLHSVLLVPNDGSKEIRVFHKSFPDFLQDRDRCPDPKFFIDPPNHHAAMAIGCLRLLKKLRPDPCDLPDFVMNREVVDLPELLEDKVGSATRYACGYWAMHIRSSPTTDDYYASGLIHSATQFFEKNAIPWIEVMSLENRLESVVHAIYDLLDWLGMVGVPVSGLRSLAEDCLRFTMYFFHPIQQSASHVYHSALPLSPTSSTFLSRTLNRKTKITGFYGRPDAWGVIVRNITTNPKGFTSMTTFGNKIAAIYHDGTVSIYDSVTGVLKLSLSLADPPQAIRGSPDGSILFCAHKVPSITLWDMQTGGLIHTFHLQHNAEDIAISLKGRYLACGWSDGSIEVWEVADNMEGVAIWTSSLVTRFCWTEPEELIAVSTGESVRIWDIVAGTTLHSFTIRYPVYRMLYSQKFNQLAVTDSNTITIIDPQISTSATSLWTDQKFSCFAFSQTAQELVCGMETHGLQLFDISSQRFKEFEYPDVITSVSTLKNGTVVANFASSGIQLLSLDRRHTPSQQTTIPTALTVNVLDHGKILAIFPTSRDHISLLDPATMSQVFKIPSPNIGSIHIVHTTILCASYENLIVVYYFKEGDRGFLQLWKFQEETPRWTVEVDGVPKIGQVSPTARWLVTLHTMGHLSRAYAWNVQTGKFDGRLEDIPPYLDIEFIEFISEDRFYLDGGEVHLPYHISFAGIGISGKALLPSSSNRPHGRWCLDVDDTREWVLSLGRRICWIPPRYIGSIQPSYCWIGYSLIMVGHDGILRKFTFSFP